MSKQDRRDPSGARNSSSMAVWAMGVLRAFTSLVHVVVSFAAFGAIAYVLGHGLLDGTTLGNDSPLHIAYATWLEQYFPTIPRWYPVHGGGTSLAHGYPILPHYLLVAVSRLGQISILQGFRLITFLSFPVTAIGIYFLGWSMFRKRTVGLIAGLLYLLAPITWTWVSEWGFFSQSVGMMLLPFGILVFDRYLASVLERPPSGIRNLWLACLVVLMAIAFLMHIIVGAALTATMLLLAAATALVGERRGRARRFAKALGATVRAGVVTGIVLAAYLVPFYLFSSYASRGGVNLPPLHALNRIPVMQFLGIAPVDGRLVLTRMANPLATIALAIVGGILGSRHSSKALALALVISGAAVYALVPEVSFYLGQVSHTLGSIFGLRPTLLAVMMLLPVLAGFGAWSIGHTLTAPIVHLAERIVSLARLPSSLERIRSPLAASAALLVMAVGITYLGRVQHLANGRLPYGPIADGFDPNDPWNRNGEVVHSGMLDQVKPAEWPPFELSDTDPGISRSRELARLLPEIAQQRIDISPYLGRLAMDLAAYSASSQLNSYTYQINLIHTMWAYQQNVYYSRETPANEYGNPTSLNSTSQWMGTQYVFIQPANDSAELYEAAGWTLQFENDELQLWEDPNAPELATLFTQPVVLVISKPEADGYATIFRKANDGFLPYEEAILVEGRPRLDSYTLEELALFDAVVLYGHDYRNSRKAWQLLDEYVSGGGGLFVDTGWEFWIPEWEFDPAPAVLPISKALWTDYGVTSDYSLSDPVIAGEIDLTDFKPLSWEGQPWTLSGADAADIRPWGKSVLSAAGRPLIVAGEHGQGRVVWSGMNLIGHARYGDPSTEELRLFGNLIRWSAGVHHEPDLAAPTIAREHPDQVAFQMKTAPGERSWLYWREAYYPNWHAYVTESAGEREIPIFRGGPSFMLMPIETADAQATVSLRWELPLVEQTAVVASLVGVLLLIALVADGLFLRGNGFTWLRIALIMRTPKPFLGEGSNREWAEQKRAELEAGRLSPDTPPQLVPSQAISWWRGDRQTVPAAEGGAGGEPQAAETRAQTSDSPGEGPAAELPLDSQRANATGYGDSGPEGHRAHDPGHADSAAAGRLTDPRIGVGNNGGGQQSQQAPAIEPPTDDIEQALLEAWLNGSGHNDDAWAEKLLSRRKPTA